MLSLDIRIAYTKTPHDFWLKSSKSWFFMQNYHFFMFSTSKNVIVALAQGPYNPELAAKTGKLIKVFVDHSSVIHQNHTFLLQNRVITEISHFLLDTWFLVIFTARYCLRNMKITHFSSKLMFFNIVIVFHIRNSWNSSFFHQNSLNESRNTFDALKLIKV